METSGLDPEYEQVIVNCAGIAYLGPFPMLTFRRCLPTTTVGGSDTVGTYVVPDNSDRLFLLREPLIDGFRYPFMDTSHGTLPNGASSGQGGARRSLGAI